MEEQVVGAIGECERGDPEVSVSLEILSSCGVPEGEVMSEFTELHVGGWSW